MVRYSRIAAFAWATAASSLFLLGPVYTNERVRIGVGPSPSIGSAWNRTSALEVNGPDALVPLLLPVLLTLIPILIRGRAQRPSAHGAIFLLTLFCLLSAASVGVFYLPSLFLLAVGALNRGSRARATPGPRPL